MIFQAPLERFLSLSNLFFAMRMHRTDSSFGDPAGRALNIVSDARTPMQQLLVNATRQNHTNAI